MSKHMKRLASPRRWRIAKKEAYWTVKPSPGAHAQEDSVPLGLVLRDYLKVAGTMREARRILGQRDVLVDGRVVTSHKFGVGFMDVVSIPKMEKHWRVFLDHHGRLFLADTPASAATWKLCRIENKTVVKGGRLQLNLHDGRNLLVKETHYKTGDVIKVHVPEQKVLGHFPLGGGNVAVITGGAHAGETGSVQSVEVTRGPAHNIVNLAAGEKAFSTIKPYVFVVGKEKPEIKIPTAVEVA